MKVNWLIEDYGSKINDIVDEVIRQGHNCSIIDEETMKEDPDYLGIGLPRKNDAFTQEDCVLFLGTINTAKWLQLNRPDFVVWLNAPEYKCSSYYPYFEGLLLNSDYVFLPKKSIDVRSIRGTIKEVFKSDRIFIRPDSGLKGFTGQVFDFSANNHQWSKESIGMHWREMVVLASPKDIEKEFRFVCTEQGEIISGCQYLSTNPLDTNTTATKEAWDKCKEVLDSSYFPDPMFTVDICCSNGKYYLLELNGFCTAGLYDDNLTKIISKASELALKYHSQK